MLSIRRKGKRYWKGEAERYAAALQHEISEHQKTQDRLKGEQAVSRDRIDFLRAQLSRVRGIVESGLEVDRNMRNEIARRN